MLEITEQNLFQFPSSDGIHRITAFRFPVENPRAVVQIVHGMIDHTGHYLGLIEALNRAGVAVVSCDHLGHGRTAETEEDFGYFGGKGSREFVVSDLHTLTGIAKQDYPGIPFILLGHSMGSFLVRMYATRYGSELNGLIILGTGGPNPILPIGKLLVNLTILFRGQKCRSKLLAGMAFSGYTSKYEKGAPGDAWITRDGAILDERRQDPYGQFIFTASGYRELFGMTGEVNARSWAGKLRKDLPILVMSGDMDPVGGWGKGVRAVVGMLEKAEIKDLTVKLYPGARHELHSETCRDEFFSDLIAWIEARIQ